MEPTGIYKVQVDCSNCGNCKQEVDIPKGTTVDQMECPICGNKTLSKYYDVVIG